MSNNDCRQVYPIFTTICKNLAEELKIGFLGKIFSRKCPQYRYRLNYSKDSYLTKYEPKCWSKLDIQQTNKRQKVHAIRLNLINWEGLTAMNTISQSYTRQQGVSEEQVFYDYLLQHVRTDSPEQLIENFRCLFVKSRGFQEAQLYAALDKLVKKKNVEYRFNDFFNRCCHILINSWQMQPQLHYAIPQFVALFENLAPPRHGYHNTANRVRYLVKNFTESEQYVKLQRLGRVINNKQNPQNANSVGNLIYRYPYLYNHCLLGRESSQEHQQTVRHIKAQTERRFEVNLSQYVTYKVRLAAMARSPQFSQEDSRIIRPVENPTLLKDRELSRALKHFIGTVNGGYTYKSLSQSFLTHTVHTKTFEGFKDDLYEYILGSLDTKYTKGQFN
ncbi:MAG: hypothetical protein AAGF26_11550, partial [Cyanobacteria bacterium P01_G01_bin.49]